MQSSIQEFVLTLVLVGVGVGEALGLSGLPSDHAVEVGASLVGASLLHGVALGALLDEDLLSLGNVTHFYLSFEGLFKDWNRS